MELHVKIQINVIVFKHFFLMPYYLEALSLFMLHKNIIWEKCFHPSIAVWELTISPNGASLVVIMGKNGVANDNFNATKPPIITATSSLWGEMAYVQ